MIEDAVHQLLSESATSTLETMFFATPDKVSMDPRRPAGELIAASLTFQGAPPGRFGLLVSDLGRQDPRRQFHRVRRRREPAPSPGGGRYRGALQYDVRHGAQRTGIGRQLRFARAGNDPRRRGRTGTGFYRRIAIHLPLRIFRGRARFLLRFRGARVIAGAKIKVLIVDDSAIVRKLLGEALAAESDMEVVGTAPDPYIARDKILALSPDVLTLDIEMPRMDGLTFLKKLMLFHPMPVIVISSLTQASCQAGVEALRGGAVEVMAKPGGPYSIGELKISLAAKIRAAAASRVGRQRTRQPRTEEARAASTAGTFNPLALIAIGASTGGHWKAIEEVLMGLSADMPGIVITQHIPAGFSRAFAERLNKFCPMRVAEAADGDLVQPGLALIAPGNFHMILRRSGGVYRVTVKDGPMVCYQRPSVDVLFSSVAEAAGPNAVAVILTGMGSDGAQGMKKMKAAGASTIAQDEASCVVFGMPKEAIRLGGVDRVVPLQAVGQAIRNTLIAVSAGHSRAH